MTNESSANAIIGNTLRIIASGGYHPGEGLTQKMASYIIELEQKLTDMAVQLANAESKCRELAAENAGLKSKGREVLNEACKVYEKLNATISSDSGDFIDGQTLHEFQFVLDVETPETDAFLAGVRAQGVDMFGQYHNFSEKLFIQKEAQKFAAKLRKGDKS